MHVVIYPSNGYFVLCPLFFAQLSEDATSALGMQEGDFQTVCATTGSLVYQADAICLALCQGFCYAIFNLEGNMVNAATAIVQELLDCALGACGFQQLNLYLTNLEEGGLHLLVFNNLLLVELQTENVGVVGENLCNVLDSNAQMFNS